jgi:diacylglycerol O-acyltransferase
MNTIRLNPLDTAWIFTESRATPNHVGGLLQFRLPADAPRDFMRQMMAEFRNHRTFTPPWNRRLKYAFNKNPAPVWIEDDDIDLEYHVRHAALPWPGGERELGELVGRLQSTPLDLMRPPWECTLIEGLEGHRFAMFIKMHHSLIDGISGMKLLQRAMSTDRKRSLDAAAVLGQWHCAGFARPARSRGPMPTMANAAEAAVAGAQRAGALAAAAGHRLRQDAQAHRRPGDGMVVPFRRAAAVGAQRPRAREAPLRHAAVPMERLRALAAAATARSTTSCWRCAAARCGASCRSATPCPTSR